MRALPGALLGTEGTTAWRSIKPLAPLTGWPSRLVANYAVMKKPDAGPRADVRPGPIVQRTKGAARPSVRCVPLELSVRKEPGRGVKATQTQFQLVALQPSRSSFTALIIVLLEQGERAHGAQCLAHGGGTPAIDEGVLSPWGCLVPG